MNTPLASFRFPVRNETVSVQRAGGRRPYRPFFLWLILGGGALFGVGFMTVLSPVERPNIILILADDMGYSDLGCMGSEIPTPNLDRLAANGLLMTQFYNAGRCCPTRASLLTGLYPHQAGVGDMTENRGVPAYQGYLNRRGLTIAEALKQAGYTTALSGKWHLGEAPENWPQRRGFDYVYGVPKGGGIYFYPALIDRQVWENDRQLTPDSTFYSTDAFNDAAVRYVAGHDRKKPFFLYLAHVAPHFPLQARPEDIARFRGKYRSGFEVVRRQRYERMQQRGLIPSAERLSSPDGRVLDWARLPEGARDTLDLKMATYAAQIACLDRGIGRLIAKLEETGQLQNTVIFFLSDNGGESATPRPPAGADERIGTRTSWGAYGASWANVSNTPFRLYKQYMHEGGISTPLIVHWPQQIRRGRLERAAVGHVLDLMPTCLALAGAAYPKTGPTGERLLPLEGQSLLPVFSGKPLNERPFLAWEHEGNRAVRQGKWKLVSAYLQNQWALYDLTTDRSEGHDLSRKHPDIVRKLTALYDAWTDRTGVIPWQKLTAAHRPGGGNR